MNRFTYIIRLIMVAALLVFATVTPAQDTPGALKFPNAQDSLDSLFRASDNATSTLAASITGASTSLTLTSASKFPASGSIIIEAEVIYYTGKAGNSLTGLVRGREATTAAGHAGGVYVKAPILASQHNILAAAIMAIQAKLGIVASTATNGTWLRGTGAGTSAWLPLTSGDLPATLDNKTLINPIIYGATISGSSIPLSNVTGVGTMAAQNATSVTVTGGTFANITCTNCTNVGSSTNGASAASNDIVQNYDSDNDAAGKYRLQSGGEDALVANNDGSIDLAGGLASYTKAGLPTPCRPGRRVVLTDNIRGEWHCTGAGWESVTGFANIKDFYASGVKASTAGNATSGSLTATLTDASTYQVGQGISIAGAGAAGTIYVSKVAGVAGNTITLTAPAPSTTVTGAVVKHDETAAIQAAMNAAANSASRTVYAPQGFYWVNGALAGAAGFEGRLIFPYSLTTLQALTILGATRPTQVFGTIAQSQFTYSDDSTIFASSESGGSIFSTGLNGFAAGIWPTFKNVEFRLPPNPQSGAIDCRFCNQFEIDMFHVGVGQYTTSTTQPTNSNVVGIRLPESGNGAYTRVSRGQLTGFYYGLDVTEHANLDEVSFYANSRGLHVPSNQNNAIRAGRLSFFNNTYNITLGGGATFAVQAAQVEHVDHADVVAGTVPAWQETLGDFDDASNLGRGYIRWQIIKQYAGGAGGCATAFDTEFLVNGGLNIDLTSLCDAVPVKLALGGFVNSWVNFGSGEETAGYIYSGGMVDIVGIIKGGTPSSANGVFLLPERICPQANKYFITFASSGEGLFDAHAKILVTAVSGGTCGLRVVSVYRDDTGAAVTAPFLVSLNGVRYQRR